MKVLTRIVGLWTVVAVAGSPSVVAACVALCAPTIQESPEDEHASHCADSRDAEPVSTQQNQLTASDPDCCPPALLAASATSPTLRTDKDRLLATALPPATPVAGHTSFRANPAPSDAVPPPSPPRSHLVLLI